MNRISLTHKIKKERKKNERISSDPAGSYTVEAALVIPILFFVLAACMILTFYLHDRGYAQGIVCEMSSAAGNTITKKERSSVLAEKKKNLKTFWFLGSRNISVNASSGNKEINAAFSSEYPIPGMASGYLAGRGNLRIQKKWNARAMDPAEFIRKIRGAEKALNGGGT